MTRWFRMYDEILDDPKVQKLPAEDFRAWVNLLALASKSGGVLPALDDIAFALRRSPNDAETLLERLLNATLIDRRNGGANGFHYAPHGWTERQYKSDTSTERVKRFRERSKAVAGTPPEPETESDTEQTPLPPADGGLGLGRKSELLAQALCRQAGIVSCGPVTVSHVRRWLEDGIAEGTIRGVVTAMCSRAGGSTLSLKRFDAPIRREHAEAKPSRAPLGKPKGKPAQEPKPEDSADAAAVRELVSGLAQSLRGREQPMDEQRAAGGAG